MTEYCKTLVIGSGFGGSVVAARLTNAGEQVTLLERGPWRDTDPVRRLGISERTPLPTGRNFYRLALHRLSAPGLPRSGLRLSSKGLFDIHYDADMSIICANGVGGGSHVYSAMNTRPAIKGYWDNHAEGVDSADMDKHYDWMLGVMAARKPRAADRIPNRIVDDLRDDPHFHAGRGVSQPAMGFDFARADYRNNSFFGSTTGEKPALDQLLLGPALQQGLTVRDRCEVCAITATGQTPLRYRVTVRDHAARRYRYLWAERVVLAAGTLNTLRLLFAARERGGLGAMPALGLGFSGNGDHVGLWWLNADHDLSTGTPTHGRFALRDYPHCPNLTRYGLNGIEDIPMPRRLRERLRRQAILVGMGADQANGLARWRRGRLRFHYSREANPVLAAIDAAFNEVGRRSKAPVHYLRRHPFTVHPLGGVRLATDANNGVINGDGQVFGHDGLYVADGAALPAAPGSPPSMSIAAWAAHVSDRISNSGETP